MLLYSSSAHLSSFSRQISSHTTTICATVDIRKPHQESNFCGNRRKKESIRDFRRWRGCQVSFCISHTTKNSVLSLSSQLKDETVIWTHQTFFFYDLPSIFLLAKRRLISRWFSSVILIMLLFLQRECTEQCSVHLPLQQEAFKQLCQVSRETRTSLLPLLLLTRISRESVVLVRGTNLIGNVN